MFFGTSGVTSVKLGSNNITKLYLGDSLIYQDPYNGHAYVDLGLPSGTKWATMNVGASSITDYGNYYQYGKGVDTYQTTIGSTNYRGTEDPLATSADTATQVMGGNWHTPTSGQCQELINNTTYEWVTNFNSSGINGAKLTAQNGNYIFFPATGYYTRDGQFDVNNACDFWTSTPFGAYSSYYWYIKGDEINVTTYSRNLGYSVRGVVG